MLLTPPISISASKLQVRYDIHDDRVCGVQLWSILPAAGTLGFLPYPGVNALFTKELVLAVVALLRVPILSDDLIAYCASDHVTELPDFISFYQSRLKQIYVHFLDITLNYNFSISLNC